MKMCEDEIQGEALSFNHNLCGRIRAFADSVNPWAMSSQEDDGDTTIKSSRKSTASER